MLIPLGFFGAGGVAGSFELISTQTFGSAGGSVTFSSIPQDYKHIKVVYSIRSTGTGSESFTTLCVRVNNNTSAYSGYPMTTYGGSSQNTDNGYMQGRSVGATTLSAVRDAMPSSNVNSSDGNTMGYGEMWIPNYSSSTWTSRTLTIQGGSAPRSGTSHIMTDKYTNGAAVTTLTFLAFSPGNNGFANFQAGSSFSLYGYKG